MGIIAMDDAASKRDFDKEAPTWETLPRIKLGADVVQVILRQVKLSRDMDVLDFGCGTGLIALQLAPHVRSVTGADTSKGMLEVFQENAGKKHLDNIRSFLLDLADGGIVPGRYHLVVSSMTFHHVKDIRSILDKLCAAIFPGGYLAVADLDLDGGLFHANHDGVFHNGFDRDALRSMFVEAGLEDVCDIPAAEMTKPVQDGSERKFSIFLMTGRKKFVNK